MKQNIKDIISDLEIDIICAERDGLKGYAKKCRKALDYLTKNHETVKFDRYGWPIFPKDIK